MCFGAEPPERSDPGGGGPSLVLADKEAVNARGRELETNSRRRPQLATVITAAQSTHTHAHTHTHTHFAQCFPCAL